MVGQAKTFQPLPIGAPTPDGYYVLQVKNGIPQWDVASGSGGGGFIAGGDLSGSSSDQTVVGLQGRPIANILVTAGQIYVFNGHQWVPQNVPTGSFTAGGDLKGTSSNQTVQGIQTIPVATTAPTTGEVLQFNGTEYVPVTISANTVGPDFPTIYQFMGA